MNILDYAKKNWDNMLFFVLCAMVLVILPAFNMLDESNPLHVDSFTLSVWGKYMCYAVLAMSLNFLWGYTGLLCLCQNLFFALGGYAFGMHLMLMIGPDPVYNSSLPDFMDFLGYTELPVHWKPFDSFLFTFFAVFLVPGIVAFIFGYLAFRSRIKGVYFSILTQAFTYAASLLFFRNDTTFGGNNGFTDFKTVLGADIRSADTVRILFILSVLLVIVSFLLISWFTNSKFGKVQRAIKDSENRVLFSGYSTLSFKLFIFTVAAMLSGASGALYLPQAGIINPSEMVPSKGLDVVVWVALGGRGSKYGPIIGAVAVNLIKSWATRAYPDSWLYILGSLFVFVVIFMPNGIVGLPAQWRAYWESRKKREGTEEIDELGEVEGK